MTSAAADERPSRGHEPSLPSPRPIFASTSGGQPFHSATNVLPVYRRSSTPIRLDQKPEATRSRKRVKNAAPGALSGRRLLRPGDVVEDRRLLARGALDERLREPPAALAVEPGESAPHPGLQALALPGFGERVVEDEVDELRDEGVGGAPRALVGRDHLVRQRRAPSPTRAR